MDIKVLYELFIKHHAVSTDSRKVERGAVFFALKGENFDGNLYAENALASGASCAVIDNPVYKKDERFFLVEDSLIALQQLAAYHRQNLALPVIAITGSNGKTTTKELIRDVLKQKFRVQATEGNLNNHIGVPLTLLSLKKETEIAVVEMGANHQGEIRSLCAIAMPDYGIITNVGLAHLEGFGGFEGVKKAKGELYEYIHAKGGTIFINADNAHLAQMLKPGTKIIAYGTKPNVSCAGAILESEPLLSLQCKLKGGDKIILKSNLFGRYNFENILAAVSIGDYLGVSVEGIKKGIENYIPSINRSQVIKRGSNLIYLDAYNANPTSMEMAIQNFGSLNAEKKIVILGDMKELGSETEKEHQAVVSQLKQYVFHEKILIGEYFRKHTREEGARYFPDAESAGKWIGEKKFSGAVFLIKGSRKMKLETLADHIS